MLSGTALSAHYLSPKTKVIGVEPAGADDAYKSFKTGKLHPSVSPKTIADGLLTSLGEKTFTCIRNHVFDIVTVEEDEIRGAMHFVWERMKIIIEPSQPFQWLPYFTIKFPAKINASESLFLAAMWT